MVGQIYGLALGSCGEGLSVSVWSTDSVAVAESVVVTFEVV